jgi:(2R)-sulfolactate sulfo-lyase subunit alpha
MESSVPAIKDKERPMIYFLVHSRKDNVGVATVDIRAGEMVCGQTLDKGDEVSIKALEDIPLGHKIALKNLRRGDGAIKYGHDIGKIVAPVKAGQHVHIHNLKTRRW